MADRQNRYQQMQRYMTYVLIAALVLFVLYLIAAGFGVGWLKILLAVMIFLVCAACLAFLYVTQEFLRRRSLWMTVAAGAIAVCLLFSLILNFPSPKPISYVDNAAVLVLENI